MLAMSSGAQRGSVVAQAMDLMESWPDVAVQQVPEFAFEYCRVMREAFVYVPDALSQPDSYHVWRGIHLGPSVAGPIAPAMMTAPRDDADPLQADMVMQLPTQLSRAVSDANIDHSWTWMVLGASTTDPINHISEDVSANSLVSGRQPAHDDDDYDGADDNQPNADDGTWSVTSSSSTWSTPCSTTGDDSDGDFSWEGDRVESDSQEAFVVREGMERDVH